MRIVGQRPDAPCERSRHPEVNQESATRFEPNNQILAPALDRRRRAHRELAVRRSRVERPDRRGSRDLDVGRSARPRARARAGADGLDLGQLGHVRPVSVELGRRPLGRLDTVSRRPRAAPGARRGGLVCELVRREHGRGRLVGLSLRRGRGPRRARRPRRRASPRFARQTMPTAWSTTSAFVRRPAPSSMAAMPIADGAELRHDPGLRRRDCSRTREQPAAPTSEVTALRLDPAAPDGLGACRRRRPPRRGGGPRRRRCRGRRARAAAAGVEDELREVGGAVASHGRSSASRISSAFPTARPERLVHVGEEADHLPARPPAEVEIIVSASTRAPRASS